jgi:hypothetical protein
MKDQLIRGQGGSPHASGAAEPDRLRRQLARGVDAVQLGRTASLDRATIRAALAPPVVIGTPTGGSSGAAPAPLASR